MLLVGLCSLFEKTYLFSVNMHVPELCICTMFMKCPGRPEEGTDSPEAGVAHGCNLHYVGAESLARAVIVLNY